MRSSAGRTGVAAGAPAGGLLGLALAVAVLAMGAALAARTAIPPAADAATIGSGKGLKKKRVGNFERPVHVAVAPGVRATYVVEQFGRVRVLKRNRPFLDIRELVKCCFEEGLLSIAFHPNFQSNRLAYVYYTNKDSDNVVAEVKAKPRNPLVARAETLRTVLVVPHPGEINHNGGALVFGPKGLLYIGSGDGGGARDPDDSAQDTDSLLGKILRIDPRRSGSQPYSVPPSNPFVDRAGRDEIYSLGLRNPFRFSFHRTAKGRIRIAIGDVGESSFEEVDLETLGAARGANFGWNDFEGFMRTPFGQPPLPARHTKPVFAYAHGVLGRCSVIGGFVVRDRRLPRLRGRYAYGDFCSSEVRSFIPSTNRGREDRSAGVRVRFLSSFGEGRGGALYATSLDGPVFRIKQPRPRKR